MQKRVIYLIFTLLIASAACGSCSRYHQSAYHGPNRVGAKPHREWKQPKSRYKRLSDEVTKRRGAEDVMLSGLSSSWG